MKQFLIVWHSRTGGSEQLAAAAQRGADAQPEVRTCRLRAAEAQADDVLAADALLFVAPENLGALSGEMKEFFDRTYYVLLDRCPGRPFALMVCAGSDGQGAVRQVERIATGLRWRRVAESVVVCTHAQTAEAILATKHLDEADLARAEELGATLAAGLALGLW